MSGTDNFRPAQRQLNMASVSESPYNAYRQHVTSSSTPKESSHQKQEMKFHDLSLDSLEITRQKLLVQREKELARLKQQELKRVSTLSNVAGSVGSNQPEGKLIAGKLQGNLDFGIPDQQRSTASIPPEMSRTAGQDNSHGKFFNSEDQRCGSAVERDPSKEPVTPNVMEQDLSSRHHQAWASQQQYSSHRDLYSASDVFPSFGITGRGTPSQRPYSVAVMEHDEVFSSNAELDSASDKENQQAGTFHRDFYPQKLDTRAPMLSERNILSKNGGQDWSYDRKFALVSAWAKGFLTRRLLKSDKIQALVKTVTETKALLNSISAEESHSVQDKELKARVETQLKAARNSLSDVFHKIPAHERMAYITHSRNLAKDREARRHKVAADSRSKPLSVATVRAMLRRQEAHTPEGAEQKKPLPSRHPKKTWNIRVLKPMQGNASPARPDTTRSKRQATRPTTAPERSLAEKGNDKKDRPLTTATAARQPAGRVVLGGNVAVTRRRVAAQPVKRTVRHAVDTPTRQEHAGEVRRAVGRPRIASPVKKTSRTVAANFGHFK